MAYNFPDSPSNGDTVTINGIVYTYNSTKGAWKTTAASGGAGGGGASVTVSETAPTSPSEGDLWFDPSVLKTFVYYNDGTANQWVQSNPTGSGGGASGGASVTVSETAPTSPSAGDLWWSSSEAVMYIYYTDTDSSQWVSTSVPGVDGVDGADGADGADGSAQSYTNLAAFPSTGNTLGDLAVAQDTKALYMWDGTEWDRIYNGPNEDVTWTTEPPERIDLAIDGSTSSFTVAATDPEGFDITYSYDTSPSNQTQATISQSAGTFTFTPSTTLSDAGVFTFRSKASDGLNVSARTSTISLQFFDGPYLVAGDGTQIIGSGGGTTVTLADTVSDASLQNDAGRIDNTGELILFTGMPAFSFDPTSSDRILVYAVQYDYLGGASIGISAVDSSSRGLQDIAYSGAGWAFGTSSGYYSGSNSLTTGKWYIIAIQLATGAGAGFDARIYNVTDNTWLDETTSGGSQGYGLCYLPVDGTYDNHMAFFGANAPSPVAGYTARGTMSHKVGGVGVMNNSAPIDTLITQFKNFIFT